MKQIASAYLPLWISPFTLFTRDSLYGTSVMLRLRDAPNALESVP
jgi:hypothetical protein